MPMSTLYLFGRKQDFGYELAQAYSVVASRHHFRIWKAPVTWNGQTMWAGAGTHDIGFEKDQRNGKVTHKIDPAVDGERDNIGQTLQPQARRRACPTICRPIPCREPKTPPAADTTRRPHPGDGVAVIAPASLRLRSGQALPAVPRASRPRRGGRDARRHPAGRRRYEIPVNKRAKGPVELLCARGSR